MKVSAAAPIQLVLHRPLPFGQAVFPTDRAGSIVEALPVGGESQEQGVVGVAQTARDSVALTVRRGELLTCLWHASAVQALPDGNPCSGKSIWLRTDAQPNRAARAPSVLHGFTSSIQKLVKYRDDGSVVRMRPQTQELFKVRNAGVSRDRDRYRDRNRNRSRWHISIPIPIPFPFPIAVPMLVHRFAGQDLLDFEKLLPTDHPPRNPPFTFISDQDRLSAEERVTPWVSELTDQEKGL